jgi:hypothetical protein
MSIPCRTHSILQDLQGAPSTSVTKVQQFGISACVGLFPRTIVRQQPYTSTVSETTQPAGFVEIVKIA